MTVPLIDTSPDSSSAQEVVLSAPDIAADSAPDTTSDTTGERPQSLGEEIANSVSHGIGALGSLMVFPFLVLSAAHVDLLQIIAVSVFAITVVLLYLASTLFHALPEGAAKRVFQVLDHGAIYLLIAGTYTPVTLGVLRGTLGWTLFGLVWGLAVGGCVWKAVKGVRASATSTWLYLAMSWMIILAGGRVMEHMPLGGLLWLAAGGLCYTVGTLFFALSDRYRYCHFVWHLFVLAGTSCHVVMVMGYSARNV